MSSLNLIELSKTILGWLCKTLGEHEPDLAWAFFIILLPMPQGLMADHSKLAGIQNNTHEYTAFRLRKAAAPG